MVNHVNPESSRIFISYHREDTPADTGRLADTLEREFGPKCVFQDVSEIEPGDNWERIVDHMLENTVALLLVIGPSWVLTEPLERELDTALQSGVAIIPVLVRDADWDDFAATLPDILKPIEKLNAKKIDHNNWRATVQPLVDLLRRILKDPARARIICKPPEPRTVLENPFNKGSVRSMLVHAADIAECLDDPSVLEQAQSIDARADSTPPYYELIIFLEEARYRLLIEEIGRDFLATDALYATQYLQDTVLESEISSNRTLREEARTLCAHTRGEDGLQDFHMYNEIVLDAEVKAKSQLRGQLPGITKKKETRERLFRLVRDTIQDILSRGHTRDDWDYIILSRFCRYSNMPFFIRDESKALTLLQSFESSRRSSNVFWEDVNAIRRNS